MGRYVKILSMHRPPKGRCDFMLAGIKHHLSIIIHPLCVISDGKVNENESIESHTMFRPCHQVGNKVRNGHIEDINEVMVSLVTLF